MTRTVTDGFSTASKAGNHTPVLAAEMEFKLGTVRINTSLQALPIGGNQFIGVGNLGAISIDKEEASLVARGVRITLSGVDPALIATALNDDYQNRLCRVWLCLLDSDHQLIADPAQLGTWRMDSMPMNIGKECTITLTGESAFIAAGRAKERFYTDNDHKSRFPGDTFFELMQLNADKELLWGRE